MEFRNGKYLFGGMEASELAEEFGTPLYVYEEDLIRDHGRRHAFDEVPVQIAVLKGAVADQFNALSRLDLGRCLGGGFFCGWRRSGRR